MFEIRGGDFRLQCSYIHECCGEESLLLKWNFSLCCRVYLPFSIDQMEMPLYCVLDPLPFSYVCLSLIWLLPLVSLKVCGVLACSNSLHWALCCLHLLPCTCVTSPQFLCPNSALLVHHSSPLASSSGNTSPECQEKGHHSGKVRSSSLSFSKLLNFFQMHTSARHIAGGKVY